MKHHIKDIFTAIFIAATVLGVLYFFVWVLAFCFLAVGCAYVGHMINEYKRG